MPYIDPETLQKAKEIDLLTYLQNYEPQELVHVSNNVYSTVTHDSLIISNGKWCWNSQSIGGKSAIDYLIASQGLSFYDAVNIVLGNLKIEAPQRMLPNVKEKKPFELPSENKTNDKIIEYLLSRGINQEIIDYCIDHKLIYESKKFNNLVFVGYDNKVPKYAVMRGTMGIAYKGEVEGSDKRYSFKLIADNTFHAKTVHVFESAIDAMSCATLMQMHNKDWQKDDYISLGGVVRTKKDGSMELPKALGQYLTDYPNIDRIILRTDSDMAGQNAAEAIGKELQGEYTVLIKPAPIGKDFNEYLCIQKQIPIRKDLPISKKSKNDLER